MYSPIEEDLVPVLYWLGKEQSRPMTVIVDEILRRSIADFGPMFGLEIKTPELNPKSKLKITSNQLRMFLYDKRIVLDCGHLWTHHNFSNTMVVSCSGTTQCHECYL